MNTTKENLIDLAIIVLLSFLIAWFMMFPFVDFLSSRIKHKEEIRPIKTAPVELIPAPINYDMPCDDTDCIFETQEESII